MKLFPKLVFFIFITLAAIELSSCGSNNPITPTSNTSDSCGADQSRTIDITPFGLTVLPPSSLTNGRRVYNFYKDYDSICTDKHVTVTYRSNSRIDSNIRFAGVSEWFIFFQTVDSGSYSYFPTISTKKWEAENNVGLKQAYGDLPGAMFVNIYADFPTKGSVALDSIYLMNNLFSLGWTINYAKHKYPADDNMISSKNYNELKFIFKASSDNQQGKSTFIRKQFELL
jgi:hypothetical protein